MQKLPFQHRKTGTLVLSLAIIFILHGISGCYLVQCTSAYVEKQQNLTLYNDQYTICHLDNKHHYSAECWLVPTDRNIRDYLEALSSVR